MSITPLDMGRRNFPVTRAVEKPASFPPPVSVVVPTFREAAGLRALVERVREALSGYGAEWELLLVDDDSGDGSEEVVAALAGSAPVRLHVRREPPRDLSRSVLLGVRLARFDRVVVMDADLSHPPERIPALLGALDAGAELALGSRYVPGASVDRGWSRTGARARASRPRSHGPSSLAPTRSRASSPRTAASCRRPSACAPAATRLRWSSWCAGGFGSPRCPSSSTTGASARAR